MTDGPTMLELRIARFEELLEEMREATREAHSTLKEVRTQRREIEQMLGTDIRKTIETRVDNVVSTELNRIGPQIQEQTSRIYARVTREVDKLIDISLGKEFSSTHGREDLRPQLAEKMRIWIKEVIMEDDE
jgi:uncharacterized NAD(P)/FAD-binding protein YdhS